MTGRILPTNPAQEDIRYSLPPIDQVTYLQELFMRPVPKGGASGSTVFHLLQPFSQMCKI